jgi:predicted metallo-beta-lactamase superfamily hydrolase
MEIEILTAESLGVRGLGCYVTTGERRILIDPGFALGYLRHKRLPHPRQVALAEMARRRMIDLWKKATDIVLSHFHGDHVPLVDANPYQLRARELVGLNQTVRIWRKTLRHLSFRETAREASLRALLRCDFLDGEDVRHGPLRFSGAVPHGDPEETDESVMMTLVEEGRRFVHAPDIQLLHGPTVTRILEWQPDILLVGGPPLYLFRLTKEQIDRAWQNALRLVRGVDVFILDHHLLRSTEGVAWLDQLSTSAGRRVLCAADYMGRERSLMEAEREQLYHNFPVAEGWHGAYAKGEASTEQYR